MSFVYQNLSLKKGINKATRATNTEKKLIIIMDLKMEPRLLQFLKNCHAVIQKTKTENKSRYDFIYRRMFTPFKKCTQAKGTVIRKKYHT
jgi:hypothetical protein